MSERLPKVFLGCSTESYRIAQAIQNNLYQRNVAFTKIWPNVFEPSHSTDQDLLQSAPTFDFAIFVLSPDDDVKSRGVEQKAPRDNVIYELGLFMGILSRDRVFLVRQRNANLKLPSDLTGVNPIDYIVPPDDEADSWEAALGPPSSIIETTIRKRGLRAVTQEVIRTSEEQYQIAAKFFDQFLKDKYGVSAVKDSITLTITDLVGSATIKRACNGLRVSGGLTMGRITEKVETPTPGSKIIRHPYFVRDPVFKKPVLLEVKVPGEQVSEFDVVIGPPLSQSDDSLDYEYAIEIYKFCLMTREEVNKAYQGSEFHYEYISLRIVTPTDQAAVKVMFPQNYAASTFPAVFIGNSDSLHESELNRASSGFQRTSNGAEFTVDKPIVGFTYLIYWVSPTQEDFDKMLAQH